MGRDTFFYPGCKCGFTDYLPESQPCHTTPSAGNKQVVALFSLQNKLPGCFKVNLDFFLCLLPKRDQAFFVAFAKNADKTCGNVAC